MQGLIEKGWVKAKNFRNSKNKLAYAYCLTPIGIDEKTRVTVSYLKKRIIQYEELEEEIKQLRLEAKHLST